MSCQDKPLDSNSSNQKPDARARGGASHPRRGAAPAATPKLDRRTFLGEHTWPHITLPPAGNVWSITIHDFGKQWVEMSWGRLDPIQGKRGEKGASRNRKMNEARPSGSGQARNRAPIAAATTAIHSHIAALQLSEANLRQLNQDLAGSEAKYRSIVDHAPFGIFTTRGMTLVFSNRYNSLLAGLDPREEKDPDAVRRAIHPEDRERVIEEFAQAVAEGQPYETVFRFLHPDGTIRKVLSRRIPIRDHSGEVVMYQGFNVDITALDLMQSRLRRAERLATLGQVAAGIAHEIRNPLVGIGSTTSLLLDDTDPTDARRPDLAVILQETKRLDRIVNQIIEYARPRPPWLRLRSVGSPTTTMSGRRSSITFLRAMPSITSSITVTLTAMRPLILARSTEAALCNMAAITPFMSAEPRP